ncbi:lipase family protein, partial [Pseudomonas sp. SDO5511_1_S431]
WDLFRDIDANQAPLEPSEGVGQAHRGFYGAAQALREFVVIYLDKFHNGQTLIITGHSLGGAIALLLAEMLRRRDGFVYD